MSSDEPARRRWQRQDCHTTEANQSYGRCMTFPWIIDLLGATGALLTTVCWLPQTLKVLRERDTRALSLRATGSFTVGITLWLVYGIAINDWPLIGSSAVTLALIAPILVLKLRYR